jgi:phage gpG-like protein
MLIIRAQGLAGLGRQLSRFAGDIRSTREPIDQAIEEVIIPRVKLNFEGQESAGEDWADINSATYFMPYRRNHPNGNRAPLLRVGGTMYNAVTAKERWSVTGQGDETSAVAQYPSFVPYAEPHERGFTSLLTGGWVPARPYFVINQQDQEDIETIFNNWLTEQFGKRTATGEVISEDLLN